MTKRYQKIVEYKKAYDNGYNIMSLANEDAIEIAYDLQAGSYIKLFNENREQYLRYANAISEQIDAFIKEYDVVLDCGCGELTTSALISKGHWIAFDSSLSRLMVGSKNVYGIELLCCDMTDIPLEDSSVDWALSIHAIEPNIGNEEKIIKEMARVSRKGLLLFEPCYERASEPMKQRMDRHRYARNIEHAIRNAGLDLKMVKEIESINEYNITTFMMAEHRNKDQKAMSSFVDLIERKELKEIKGSLVASCGLIYPIIRGIPVIKNESAILCSKYIDC